MRQIQSIMTKDPACCMPDTDLREVARMMCERDCGEIPVVDSLESRKPVGVITDRDITCRTLGRGRNPLELKVKDCFSTPAVTVSLDSSVEEVEKTLAEHQIRRVPVVDRQGRLCGIVAQADLALKAPAREVAQILQEVSQPKAHA